MKRRSTFVLSLCLAANSVLFAQSGVTEWLTKADKSVLFQQQAPIALAAAPATTQIIDVDAKQTFQTMDGFGYALTGGSAYLIAKMSPEKRAALLHDLFATDGSSIGVSYIRLSVGSSDMNDHVYSYDDVAKGETDPTMAKFSLDADKSDVIPVMKEILAINPKIKILASPWSAPLWMKTTGVARGGVLMPQYFAAYAQYWVKYLQGMKDNGITIDTLTVQNEPLNEKNTPSMLMLESEQEDFIKNNLGPALQKAGLKTKIVLYDHNLDHPLYPLTILRDKDAAKYIDGTGFHLYGGTVDAMTQVHNEFPKKNIYFTEQSLSDRGQGDTMNIAKPFARIMVGVSRNWSKNILLWNLAADPQNGPHTNDGGCSGCTGAITIDGDNTKKLVAYYTMAHASKFVRPDSVRIASNTMDTLPNVAFKTPEGKTVLMVSNVSDAPQKFDVRSAGKVFTTSLDAGSVATYIW